jgi:hypothetical protein
MVIATSAAGKAHKERHGAGYPYSLFLQDFDIGGHKLKSAHLKMMEDPETLDWIDRGSAVVITGKASRDGDFQFNLKLGLKRAAATADALRQALVGKHRESWSASQFSVRSVSFAEAKGRDPASMALDRCVEVRVIPFSAKVVLRIPRAEDTDDAGEIWHLGINTTDVTLPVPGTPMAVAGGRIDFSIERWSKPRISRFPGTPTLAPRKLGDLRFTGVGMAVGAGVGIPGLSKVTKPVDLLDEKLAKVLAESTKAGDARTLELPAQRLKTLVGELLKGVGIDHADFPSTNINDSKGLLNRVYWRGRTPPSVDQMMGVALIMKPNLSFAFIGAGVVELFLVWFNVEEITTAHGLVPFGVVLSTGLEIGGPGAQAGVQVWAYAVGPYRPGAMIKDITEMNDWLMSSGVIFM